jgi:hypothetical protein
MTTYGNALGSQLTQLSILLVRRTVPFPMIFGTIPERFKRRWIPFLVPGEPSLSHQELMYLIITW